MSRPLGRFTAPCSAGRRSTPARRCGLSRATAIISRLNPGMRAGMKQMGAPEGFEDVVATILPREGGPARPIFRFAAGVHRSSPMPRGAGAATRVSGADRWQRWLKTARTCSNGSGPSGEDSSRMISAMSKGYPGLSSRRKIRSVLSSARMPSAPFLRTEDAPRRPAANLDASSPVSAAGQPADLFASCPGWAAVADHQPTARLGAQLGVSVAACPPPRPGNG